MMSSRYDGFSVRALTLVCALFWLSSCDGCSTPENETENNTTSNANAAPLAHAEQLYARYCTLCHGANGEGYAADHANALFNADFLSAADNAFVTTAIKYGRPGTPMAAWSQDRGGPLTNADVDALVTLIASHRRPARPAAIIVPEGGVSTRGGAIFAAQCASCHGPSGEGVTAVSLSHPYFQATASNSFLAQTITHGREGTPMAAFSFPPVGMADLITFLRQLPVAPQVATVMQSLPAPPGMQLNAHATATADTALADLPLEALPAANHLAINPQGPLPHFTLREERFVSAEQVNNALTEGKRLILLDARATSDWSTRHIRGAAPFPFYSVDELVRRLPRDGTFIVAYCACPHAASGHVVDQLRERGFRNTAVLDEGIHFWIDQHYPTARGEIPAPPAE